MHVRLLMIGALLGSLVGCRFGQLSDPNEEKPNAKYDGAALQANVRKVDELLGERLVKGEINLEKKKEILHDYIRDQVAGVDLAKVTDDQVWRFADVYRQLEDWQTTHDLYVRAVDSAKDEDRRVNDTLRLAEAKAKLGDVEAGIGLVRSTFDVAPEGKAPILFATLYEFAPAAVDKGHDLDVAQLIEGAMEQHLQTIVDPESEAGLRFMQARVHHLRQGWEFVFRIYRQSGEAELMRAAVERADAMMRKFAIA